MKSKKTTESTQTQTPYARPELTFALDQNRDLFNLLSSRTDGVAPFNDIQNQAFGLGINRATNGSAATGAASGAITDIANNGALGGAGDFLSNLASGGGSNPAAQYFLGTARGDYLDPTLNPAFGLGAQAINEQIGSIFERAGRTGSGANQSSVSRGVADLYSGLYNQERGRQLDAAGAIGNLYNSDIANSFNANSLLNADAQTRLAAAGLAPSVAESDYRDINALLNIGNLQQGQTQAEMDFPYNNLIQAQTLLNAGVGGLAPLQGGTQTGKTVETTSPGLFNSILGGLLTGASVFGGGGPLALGGIFGGSGGGAATGGGWNPNFTNPSTI